MTKTTLIQTLIGKGVLRSARIKHVLEAVDRADFVPLEEKRFAYMDEALSIGFGQTISQPYTVVFMLERLDVQEGDVVLEIGYGSGWQTALLADLVGAEGKIHAMELVPELCEFGKANVEKYPEIAKHVSFYCQNASGGLSDVAKNSGGFNRIIAAAEVKKVPVAWRTQLKTGGVLVYPQEGSLFKETKNDKGEFGMEEYPGFAFVPFIEAER